MNSFNDFDATRDGVEDLIRAAGGYVQVSEDLRPRLLEQAREYESQQRRRHVTRLFTVLALAMALWGLWLRQDARTTDFSRHGLPTAGSWDWQSAAETAMRAEDGHWNMVESFLELRRRHAAALRTAPDAPRPGA